MTKPIANAYPLQWPAHQARAKKKAASQFKVTLNKSLNELRDELRRFGEDTGKAVTNVVISSNVTLGVEKPEDPGVAVYFDWDGEQRCIPVDRYPTPRDNVRAIFLILEARRTEMRHGGLEIVRATFTGFKALPAPGSTVALSSEWWRVLGLDERPSSLAKAKAAHREALKAKHPDKGGTDADAAAINDAYAQAQREFGDG